MIVSRSTPRGQLQEWLRFLRAEGHVLALRPWLLFQQAANQPAGSGVPEAAP